MGRFVVTLFFWRVISGDGVGNNRFPNAIMFWIDEYGSVLPSEEY